MANELGQAVEGSAYLNTLATISSIDMWVKPLKFVGMVLLFSGIGLALASIVRVLRWQPSRPWIKKYPNRGAMKMKIGSKTGRFVTGLIVGSLVGAAAGMIFAPRPGRETRDAVQHQTVHYVGTLRRRFERNSSANGLQDRTDAQVEVLN